MANYSNLFQEKFNKVLREALEKLGFKEHPILMPGFYINQQEVEVCYDCTSCGCLVSQLDTHIQACTSLPSHIKRAIKNDTESAALIILDVLRKRRGELTEQELEQLYACKQGPYADRLDLVSACSEVGIGIYPFLLAERELLKNGQIFSFCASVFPEQDLKLALPGPVTTST